LRTFILNITFSPESTPAVMKLSTLFIAATIAFGACTPTDQCATVTVEAPAAEVTTLEQYLNANGIVATKDSRGFYYKVVNAGTGVAPNLCNSVRVAYTGTLTDGSQFDANTNATLALGSVIKGWQEALPLIKKGGFIKVFIPPTLGYGDKVSGAIPANSILIFDIELMDVL
jgi:FKBP-type peptidyl-prolyl cis-trans isomerase FkpA